MPHKPHLYAAAIILTLSTPAFAQEESVPQYSPNPNYKDAISKLTPEQYTVTQEGGTEAPFHNAYWNNHADGIYVDVVSGKPLFSSKDKYDSGTGWPSFTKPIDDKMIETKVDKKLGIERTEVVSKDAGSHLGHVFNDGPPEKGGQRFCINSVSMRFIPKEKLEAEGYGEYKKLFEGK